MMKLYRHIFLFVLVLTPYISLGQTTEAWRDSVSVLQRQIDANPKSIELRMRKAEANIMLEQWKYALDEYSYILDNYPGHIGALYFRAFVNLQLRRYSFSRLDYEAVLKFEHEHKGAMMGLVRVNLCEQRLQEAFDLANRLVELYPDDSHIYHLRAEVEEARGMLDLAIDDIDKAIELESRIVDETKKRVTIDDDLTLYVYYKGDLLKQKGDSKGLKRLRDLGKKYGIYMLER